MKLGTLKRLLLLAIPMLSFACSGGGEIIDDNGGGTEPPTEVVANLSVSKDAIRTTVLGGVHYIEVESTTKWKATSSDESWLNIFPSEGQAGVTEIEVYTQANKTNRDRNAKLTFTAGSKKQVVDVSQRWAYYFSLPCDTYKIGYGGGDIEIHGLPETDFTIKIASDASEWVQAVDEVLEVSFNEGNTSRRTTITIKDNSKKQTYEVELIQEGMSNSAKIMEIDELIINDYKCPTDALTTAVDFMYSVDMDDKTVTSTPQKIVFNGEGVQWITFLNDSKKYYSGDEVILKNLKAGTTLTFYTHSKSTDKSKMHKLIVSGLPLVEITTAEDIKDEPKVDCKIKLFDPKARTDDGDRKNLKFFESKAGIEYRGAGAQRYIKKPYNFKLYTSSGEKREAELLNIRNDNSWILDAMFLDVAHMRTRVCFDIWNEFNKPYYVDQKPKAMSGTRGIHTEVFLNGEYRGIFMLTDRIDRKQYQIEQQGGYIYKAKGWTDACRLRGCKTPSNDDYYWNSADIEQEYPDADDGLAPNFNYLADMINFVANSSKEDFSAKFEQNFDMNSIVDAFIFLNLIVAHDNIGRNTFWILRNVNESKKFMQGLWDLDGTLGRTWNRFTEDPNQGWVSSGFRIYERIISENPANIHQKIYDRWNEIKDTALSSENFAQKVEGYANIMIASGARDREVIRWMSKDVADQPNWGYANVYYNELETEIEYMKDWWGKRLKKVDSLINSLSHK